MLVAPPQTMLVAPPHGLAITHLAYPADSGSSLGIAGFVGAAEDASSLDKELSGSGSAAAEGARWGTMG
eukprot:1159675-Pelagomonas_calceolata.AAC.4